MRAGHRERRADGVCGSDGCAHRACWIEEAHVTELTGLLRGPGRLKGCPATMRVFARRERPHPGKQLTLFEAEDAWRYSLWATSRPSDQRDVTGRRPGRGPQPPAVGHPHRREAANRA